MSAGTVNIQDHGATGDGESLDTKAIQEAIDTVSEQGGGTVVAPPGVYRSGAFRLKSHVHLHLMAGSRIVGSGNLEDYHIDESLVGLISARDAEHVTISGDGILDGNGMAFANLDSLKPGGWAAEFSDGPVVMKPRPGNMLAFANCRNVSLRDVAIQGAPFWTVHLDHCDHGTMINLNIQNDPIIPNNDGIHCTTCTNILIRGCHIVAGDDPIAITGINDHGPIIPGFIGYEGVTENVIVTDCVLSTRSCGVRVGYGHNDIRKCLFSNLIIRNSNRGIGVYTRNLGSIRDVVFTNILIDTKLHDGPWWGNAEPIHVSSLPMEADVPAGAIEGVTFRDIRATGPNGIVVYGTVDSPIRDVQLENVALRLTADPVSSERGGKIDVRPAVTDAVGFFESPLSALHFEHVSGLTARDVVVRCEDEIPEDFERVLTCADCSDVLVDGLDAATLPGVARKPILLRDCEAVEMRSLSGAVSGGDAIERTEGT